MAKAKASLTKVQHLDWILRTDRWQCREAESGSHLLSQAARLPCQTAGHVKGHWAEVLSRGILLTRLSPLPGERDTRSSDLHSFKTTSSLSRQTIPRLHESSREGRGPGKRGLGEGRCCDWWGPAAALAGDWVEMLRKHKPRRGKLLRKIK